MDRRLGPYINAVLNHKFGLLGMKAQVINVYGGTPDFDGNIKNHNCITMNVPYGSKTFTWDFAFDLNDLHSPPEVFADDGFFETVSVELVKEYVPYFLNWKPSDAKCLLQLILELLALYHASRLSELEGNGNLIKYKLEIDQLTNAMNLNPTEAQVAIHNNTRETLIELTIALRLNLDNLPLTCSDSSHTTLLNVIYRMGDAAADLAVWKELESLIGPTRAPDLCTAESLVDYVLTLSKNLQDKIDSVKYSIKSREMLVSALMNLVAPAVLEVDTELYLQMSFLLENGQKQMVCLVDLPGSYPDKAPNLSIFKTSSTRSTSHALRWFKYSPKKTSEAIAQSILVVFKEALGITD